MGKEHLSHMAVLLNSDPAESRDGARGRWMGHLAALPGQARPLPVHLAVYVTPGHIHTVMRNAPNLFQDPWH